MMATKFVEKDCVFTHEGKDYESGGAYVLDDKALVYVRLGDKTVTDWHGNKLGTVLGYRLGDWRYLTAKGQPCHPYRIAYVRVEMNGREWWGRYNYDGGNLVRLRVKK